MVVGFALIIFKTAKKRDYLFGNWIGNSNLTLIGNVRKFMAPLSQSYVFGKPQK